LPGRIIAVEVREGQSATKGQKLLTLYEMTMEHMLTAPFDRTVTELKAFAGAQDCVDAQLARLLESAGAEGRPNPVRVARRRDGRQIFRRLAGGRPHRGDSVAVERQCLESR